MPYAAARGRDGYSGAEVMVTHPLTPNICDECRGVPPIAYPKAALRGATSKLRRYYWREIWTETHLRFLQWCDDQGIATEDETGKPIVLYLERDHKQEFERCEREVIEEITQLHNTRPKYVYDEPSDADVIKKYEVRVIDFKAAYLSPTRDQVLVLPLGGTDQTQAKPVEPFVAERLQAEGREVMFCESLPFQALFGCMMWMWVQDYTDPLNRVVGIGTRPDEGGSDEPIWTTLPADFGRKAYGDRRRTELERHLDFIGTTTDDLLRAFDYWLEPSRPLRQYLWAYKPEDEQRASTLIRVLGEQKIKLILRWMAESYWEHYLGWPDLFTWRETSNGPSDVFLVEVKSSGDRLSGDQRTWIQGNHEILRFDFALAKVHRTEKVSVDV
jgi:VRR-NUC domain